MVEVVAAFEVGHVVHFEIDGGGGVVGIAKREDFGRGLNGQIEVAASECAAEIVVVAGQLLRRHGVAGRGRERDQPLAGAVRLGVAAEQEQLLRQPEPGLAVVGVLLDQLFQWKA